MAVNNNSVGNQYLCKRCKKKVVNGLKCLVCDNFYHNRCAELTDNVKFLDENNITCCDSDCNNSECNSVNEDEISAAFLDALNSNHSSDSKIDIRIFKYVLKQKDSIISELRERVKDLTQHVILLKSHNSGTREQITKARVLQNNTTKAIDCSEQNINVNNKAKQTASVSQQSVLNDPRTLDDRAEVISSKPNQQLWTDVVRKTKRAIVVGNVNNIDTSSIKLQGVPRTVSMHVFRLTPETNEEQLLDYLKPMFPEITCERLNSRHPELYASFKVNIYEDNVNSFMDANIWPKNACVRRFLQIRTKLQTNAM